MGKTEDCYSSDLKRKGQMIFLEITNGVFSAAALTGLSGCVEELFSGHCALSWVCRMCGTWGSCPMMRVLGFLNHKLFKCCRGIFLAHPRIKVLQKPYLSTVSFLAEVWNCGRSDPGAVLFVVGYFIRERKATLPVCKSEESLIKLIFCYLKYAYTCFCGALRGSCSQKAGADGGETRGESYCNFFQPGLYVWIQMCTRWKEKWNSGDFHGKIPEQWQILHMFKKIFIKNPQTLENF